MAEESARDILSRVRFQVDQGSVDATVGGIDRVNNALNQVQANNAALTQSFGTLSNATSEQIAQTDALAEAFRNEQLQTEIDEMVKLAQAEQQAADNAANLKTQWDEIFAQREAAARGYGVTGGLEGPRAPGDEYPAEGSGFDLGDVNVNALSRGARGASGLARLAGAGGLAGPLMGAADLLLVARGAEELSGILPETTTAITAFGVPISGLAIAAPLAGAAIIGLIAVVGQFVETINKGTEGIHADVDQLQNQFKLEATGTSESLTLARDKAEAEQSGNQSILKALQERKQALEAQVNAAGEGNDIPATLALRAINGEIDALKKNIDAGAASINDYNQALASDTTKANDAAEAARKHAEQITDAGQRYQQYDQLSSKAIDDQVASLQKDVETRKQSIATLEDNNKTQGLSAYQIDLNNQAITKYTDANKQAEADIQHLTNISHDLAIEREAEKDRADRLKEAVKELNKDLDDLQKNFAKQAQLTADYEQKLGDVQAKAYSDRENVQQQHEDAITKVQLDASRKEEDIVRAGTDKLADIREKELEKENEAFVHYQDQLADDLTKYANDRAKLIRQEQYSEQDNALQDRQKINELVFSERQTEERDALSHEQRLAEIRRNAQQDEWNAVLDGNFEQLYIDQQHEQQKEDNENARYEDQESQLRLQLRQQEQAEAEHYNNSNQLLQLHLQQQEQEQDISLQQLETQQITAYDRKLRDLKVAEDNEINAANTAQERKLRDLNIWEMRQQSDLDAAEERKLETINHALAVEMQLLERNYTLKLQLLQQEEAALENQIRNLNVPQVPYQGEASPTPYAEGGDFGGGKGFVMSEAGYPETLKIAGRSYRVGGGAAYVMPLEGGSVDAGNKSGGGIGNLTINLQGRFDDPQANARLIAETLDNWTRAAA